MIKTILLITLAFYINLKLFAVDRTYVGTAISTAWDNPFNWDCLCLPSDSDNVIINPLLASGFLEPIITVSSAGAFKPLNVTIENGKKLTLTGGTFQMYGNWINNGGTFIQIGGTIDFIGKTTIYGTDTSNFGNILISDTLIADSTVMCIAGSCINNGIFDHNEGLVIFNGTTFLAGLKDLKFHDVQITGSVIAPSDTMYLSGNWTNDGVFIHNNGTIYFSGNDTQQYKGTVNTTFYNVVKNTSAVAVLNNNLLVAGTATVSDGKIIANTNVLGGSGNLTMTGGEIWLAEIGSIVPGFAGVYNLTGGTIVLYGDGTQSLKDIGYYNLSIAGKGNKFLIGNININGDLILDHDSATLYFGSKSVSLAGNLYKFNGILNEGTSTLILNGNTTTQQLIDSTNDLSVFNMTINKSSGEVHLNKSLEVTNHLTFTSGILNMQAEDTLIMTTNSQMLGGADNSYVDGRVIKSGSGDFTFLIGQSNQLKAVSITNLSGATDFKVMSIDSTLNNFTIKDGDSLAYVTDLGYWSVSPSNSITADITLHWSDLDNVGINDYDDLVIAHYDENAWESIGQDSRVEGNSGSITVTGVNDFSPFTFGSTSWDGTINPLPIKLIDFWLEEKNNWIAVNWTTSLEINVNHYEIERSVDGLTYMPVMKTMSNGMEEEGLTSYMIFDQEPIVGKAYYRLKEVDLDGAVFYSDIVVWNLSLEREELAVFPNPIISGGLYAIQENHEVDQIELYTQDGQLVTSTTDIGVLQAPNVKGHYYIIVKNERESQVKKLVVY